MKTQFAQVHQKHHLLNAMFAFVLAAWKEASANDVIQSSK